MNAILLEVKPHCDFIFNDFCVEIVVMEGWKEEMKLGPRREKGRKVGR